MLHPCSHSRSSVTRPTSTIGANLPTEQTSGKGPGLLGCEFASLADDWMIILHETSLGSSDALAFINE